MPTDADKLGRNISLPFICSADAANLLSKHRVLMATDVPYWRKTTGAEQRISSLARFLDQDRFQIRTCFLGGLSESDSALIAADQADVVSRTSDQPPSQFWNKSIWYANAILHQLKTSPGKNRATNSTGPDPSDSNPSDSPDPPALRDYRWPWAISAFRECIEAYQPDSILIEYLKLGYLLESIPPSLRGQIQCLVDTHDVLHRRAQQFHEHGYPHWINLTRSEEAEALRPFDTILAIQPEEATLFREMAPNCETIVCGHAVQRPPTPSKSRPVSDVLTLGYLGSGNAANIHAIESFLEHVWRPLQANAAAPRCRLLIAGEVSTGLMPNPRTGSAIPQTTTIGHLDQLDEFYDQVDVVVNPVEFGTGLKIKNCEALAYGKPVLTTPHGAAGMPADSNAACRVCATSEEFQQRIVELANDRGRLADLIAAATKLSQAGFSGIQEYSELKRVLLRGK